MLWESAYSLIYCITKKSNTRHSIPGIILQIPIINPWNTKNPIIPGIPIPGANPTESLEAFESGYEAYFIGRPYSRAPGFRIMVSDPAVVLIKVKYHMKNY